MFVVESGILEMRIIGNSTIRGNYLNFYLTFEINNNSNYSNGCPGGFNFVLSNLFFRLRFLMVEGRCHDAAKYRLQRDIEIRNFKISQ